MFMFKIRGRKREQNTSCSMKNGKMLKNNREKAELFLNILLWSQNTNTQI